MGSRDAPSSAINIRSWPSVHLRIFDNLDLIASNHRTYQLPLFAAAPETKSDHNGHQAHHRNFATPPGPGPHHRSRNWLRHGQLVLVRLPHAPNQRPRRLLQQAGGAARRREVRPVNGDVVERHCAGAASRK